VSPSSARPMCNLRGTTKVRTMSKLNTVGRGLVAGARFLPSDLGRVARYFVGEKSVGRIYVRSIFSTSLVACSDLITS